MTVHIEDYWPAEDAWLESAYEDRFYAYEADNEPDPYDLWDDPESFDDEDIW